MPTYSYYIVDDKGVELGKEPIELEHAMTLAPLAEHPQTGQKLKRCYAPPCLATKYTPGHTQNLLDTKNIEKAGFTRYVRDKLTGEYYRTAGSEGPSVLKVPPAARDKAP